MRCVLLLLMALRADGLGAGGGDPADAGVACLPRRRGHAGCGVRAGDRVDGVADDVRRGPACPAIAALA